MFSTSRFCSWSSASSVWPSGGTAPSGRGGAQTGQISDEELKQMKGGAEAPDSSGITTVKEYNYVAATKLPPVKRHLQLQADGRSHRPVRDQRLGGLEPDHSARTTASSRARCGRRPAARISSSSSCSSTTRSRCATPTPPAISTSAGRPSTCCRCFSKGCAKTRASCRASTSRSTGRTAATASSSATRSRRWPICGARRSCSRRTRRRISSC